MHSLVIRPAASGMSDVKPPAVSGSEFERVLDWSTVREHRSGDNPARWRGHLEEVLPKRAATKIEHHPALRFDELPAFMNVLRGREGVAAQALQFLIMTAARTGEVIGAQWDEFDVDKALWVNSADTHEGTGRTSRSVERSRRHAAA